MLALPVVQGKKKKNLNTPYPNFYLEKKNLGG